MTTNTVKLLITVAPCSDIAYLSGRGLIFRRYRPFSFASDIAYSLPLRPHAHTIGLV